MENVTQIVVNRIAMDIIAMVLNLRLGNSVQAIGVLTLPEYDKKITELEWLYNNTDWGFDWRSDEIKLKICFEGQRLNNLIETMEDSIGYEYYKARGHADRCLDRIAELISDLGRLEMVIAAGKEN